MGLGKDMEDLEVIVGDGERVIFVELGRVFWW